MDSSGEGSLDADELRRGLAKHAGVAVSAKEAEAMIQDADADGNGSVEWDEFLAMVARARAAGAGWLESWLPRLARLREDEKSRSNAAEAPALRAGGPRDAPSLCE